MPYPRSFVDLHTHSSASFDSLAHPLALLRRAQKVGLTHLAITDHERIDGALRARDTWRGPVRLIVGEEIRTREGDLLGLFLERPIAPDATAAETAQAIHEQGGLVGLPHPFDRFRFSGGRAAGAAANDRLVDLAGAVDFVEVHNARAYGRANALAATFAHQHGLPGVASSDAHSTLEVGLASTVVQGDFSTPAELLALLPGASLTVGRTSVYVRLWTPVAKLVQRARGNRRISGRPRGADPGGQT